MPRLSVDHLSRSTRQVCNFQNGPSSDDSALLHSSLFDGLSRPPFTSRKPCHFELDDSKSKNGHFPENILSAPDGKLTTNGRDVLVADPLERALPLETSTLPTTDSAPSQPHPGQITFNRRAISILPRDLGIPTSHPRSNRTEGTSQSPSASDKTAQQQSTKASPNSQVPLKGNQTNQPEESSTIPSQANQTEPSSSSQTPASASSEAPAPQFDAAPTAVTQPETASVASNDQPTPLPNAHRAFNITDSSLVITISRPSYAPSPAISPPPVFKQHHGVLASDHKSLNSMPIPFWIAIVLPALFFLALSAITGYRCVRKRNQNPNIGIPSARRGNAVSQQTFTTESLGGLQGITSVAEKRKTFLCSNATNVRPENGVQVHNIALQETKSYTAAQSMPWLCPAVSSPMKVAHPPSALPSDDDINPSPEPQAASGGISCKKDCTVSRTFVRSLPDELMIGVGDRVVVYLLFDDGWCLGDNLDIERHQTGSDEKFARMGVLPQECLIGLDNTSGDNSRESSPVASDPLATLEEIKSQRRTSRNGLEALAEPERSSQDTAHLLPPFHKPQRASSLFADREANLFRELEHALAFVS